MRVTVYSVSGSSELVGVKVSVDPFPSRAASPATAVPARSTPIVQPDAKGAESMIEGFVVTVTPVAPGPGVRVWTAMVGGVRWKTTSTK